MRRRRVEAAKVNSEFVQEPGLAAAWEPARNQLLAWYQNAQQARPWRLDWKRTGDPYFVWLSEIMLQQTVIKAALPIYQRFTETLPTLPAFANASPETIRSLVRGLGYYRRFALMHRAAQEVLAKGSYPKHSTEWKALPGIGVYTSAAIASICHGEPIACVDGNIERILCRLYDIQRPVNDPKLKSWYRATAQRLLAIDAPSEFNQGMMELGQQICTPKQPDCQRCPLKDCCLAKLRSHQHLSPMAKIKLRQPVDVTMHLVVFRFENKLWLSERSASAKFLKQTRGFLTVVHNEGTPVIDGTELKYSQPKACRSSVLKPFRHNITHHKLHVTVNMIQCSDPTYPDCHGGGSWVPITRIEPLLVSNLDRKALQLVQQSKIALF